MCVCVCVCVCVYFRENFMHHIGFIGSEQLRVLCEK